MSSVSWQDKALAFSRHALYAAGGSVAMMGIESALKRGLGIRVCFDDGLGLLTLGTTLLTSPSEILHIAPMAVLGSAFGSGDPQSALSSCMLQVAGIAAGLAIKKFSEKAKCNIFPVSMGISCAGLGYLVTKQRISVLVGATVTGMLAATHQP